MKRLLAIALVFGVIPVVPVWAADNSMFNGKTITYIIAAGVGGGYDSYGRLIARYMEKYLPGSRIQVRNTPNSIGVANTIYTARPDGLTIGMFNMGVIYDQLIQREGVMFDLTKFSWLGKASEDTRGLLVSSASSFKNIDDMLKSKVPIKVASASIDSSSYVETRLIAEALHLNLQIIPGFTGNQGELSMLRREVMAEEGTVDSMSAFVEAGHGFWALVVSGGPAVLPGVSRAMTYAKDDRSRRLLTLVETVATIARPTVGPPGIPTNVLAAERDALSTVMRDPQFLAEAKMLKLPIDALPGDVVEAKIKEALVQPAETITFLKEAAGVQK